MMQLIMSLPKLLSQTVDYYMFSKEHMQQISVPDGVSCAIRILDNMLGSI